MRIQQPFRSRSFSSWKSVFLRRCRPCGHQQQPRTGVGLAFVSGRSELIEASLNTMPDLTPATAWGLKDHRQPRAESAAAPAMSGASDPRQSSRVDVIRRQIRKRQRR